MIEKSILNKKVGLKAQAVLNRMRQEAGAAYVARRMKQLPGVPKEYVSVEWTSVYQSYAKWLRDEYTTGRLVTDPTDHLAFHVVAGSSPNWSGVRKADCSGKHSVAGWLRSVITRDDHFMPPDPYFQFNAAEHYAEQQAREAQTQRETALAWLMGSMGASSSTGTPVPPPGRHGADVGGGARTAHM